MLTSCDIKINDNFARLDIHTIDYRCPVITRGFPTVALGRGVSSFATAQDIRERHAKYPIPFGLCF